jgi:hypothetical protein
MFTPYLKIQCLKAIHKVSHGFPGQITSAKVCLVNHQKDNRIFHAFMVFKINGLCVSSKAMPIYCPIGQLTAQPIDFKILPRSHDVGFNVFKILSGFSIQISNQPICQRRMDKSFPINLRPSVSQKLPQLLSYPSITLLPRLPLQTTGQNPAFKLIQQF